MKMSFLRVLEKWGLALWGCCGDRGAMVAVLLFSGVVSTISLTHMERSLFNDEAYELLLTEGVNFDRFYFMSPSSAYPAGSVAPIEMGPLYFHRFLFWLFSDTMVTRADFLTPIFVTSAMMLALSCVVFFRVLRGYVSRWESVIAALLLATSYTALLFNQFVSRNTLTLIWGTLLMLIVPRFLDASQKTAKENMKTVLLCALVVFAGAWTFTTYMLVPVAVWGALALCWLRFDRRIKSICWIVLSGALFTLTFLGFLVFDTYEVNAVLFRGGYATNGASLYLKHAAWSLLSPIMYTENGDFFTEDVHIIFGRAAFVGGLIPCFVVGLVAAFRSRRKAVFLAITTWVIGVLLCALSGPNPKYLYTFFPLTLLIALLGAKVIHEWLSIRFDAKLSGITVAVLLMSSVVWDLRDIARQPWDIGRDDMNALPKRVAERGIDLARNGVNTYVQIGTGYDILNWYLWPAGLADNIYRCSVTPGLPELFQAHPPRQGAVMLVDYPPESLKDTLPEWSVPSEVTVKLIERGAGK